MTIIIEHPMISAVAAIAMILIIRIFSNKSCFITVSFKLWRGTMLTKYCSYYSEHNYDGR